MKNSASQSQRFSRHSVSAFRAMRLLEDFRERTKRFVSAAIRLYVSLTRSREDADVLVHELLWSDTPVAAHTREASRARSEAEFASKIDGALQEADESGLWLELLRDDCGIDTNEVQWLLSETNELISIFSTMSQKTKRKGI